MVASEVDVATSPQQFRGSEQLPLMRLYFDESDGVFIAP